MVSIASSQKCGVPVEVALREEVELVEAMEVPGLTRKGTFQSSPDKFTPYTLVAQGLAVLEILQVLVELGSLLPYVVLAEMVVLVLEAIRQAVVVPLPAYSLSPRLLLDISWLVVVLAEVPLTEQIMVAMVIKKYVLVLFATLTPLLPMEFLAHQSPHLMVEVVEVVTALVVQAESIRMLRTVDGLEILRVIQFY